MQETSSQKYFKKLVNLSKRKNPPRLTGYQLFCRIKKQKDLENRFNVSTLQEARKIDKDAQSLSFSELATVWKTYSYKKKEKYRKEATRLNEENNDQPDEDLEGLKELVRSFLNDLLSDSPELQVKPKKAKAKKDNIPKDPESGTESSGSLSDSPDLKIKSKRTKESEPKDSESETESSGSESD